MTKILLLDKDGTLVVPASGAKFVNIPTDQKPMDGVNNAIDYYLKNNWNLIIISNQGGVAAGHKSLEDAIAEMKFALELFPAIDEAYFCPCDIKSEGDYCWLVPQEPLIKPRAINWATSGLSYSSGFRKPHPGMIQLALGLGRDVDEVLYVGDRPEDEQAAAVANVPFMWADKWRASTHAA